MDDIAADKLGEMLLHNLSRELVGKIQSLQGGKRTAKVHAVCRTELLRLSKTAFENLTPTAIQELHEIVRQRLRRNHLAIVLQDLFATMSPAMLKKLESRLHWLHLSKGE